MTSTDTLIPAREGPRARPTTQQALAQCATLCWRGIVKIRRNPLGLTDVILGPAIFLVLFGYVFGGAIAGDTDQYLQYVFPGILVMMTLFATMGVGVALNTDLSAGIFERFRSLPIFRIAPLIGAIGSDVVRQLVSLSALTCFGLLLGVRFQTGPGSVLAGCALALAFALSLSWVWVLLGLAIDDTQAVQGLAAIIIMPAAFASNMFAPPETMPGWMQNIVAWNPVTHLVDTVRGLLMGGPVAEPLLDTVIWMSAFVLIFAPLSLRSYNRRA